MTMPADCRVETLAKWLRALACQVGKRTWKRQARAVRALVEAKVRDAIDRARIGTSPPHPASSIVPLPVENIVSRVLGGAS